MGSRSGPDLREGLEQAMAGLPTYTGHVIELPGIRELTARIGLSYGWVYGRTGPGSHYREIVADITDHQVIGVGRTVLVKGVEGTYEPTTPVPPAELRGRTADIAAEAQALPPVEFAHLVGHLTNMLIQPHQGPQ